MLMSLMEASRPLWRTWRASSGMLHRERGTPSLAGSSQAMDLTLMSSSGGKNPGATRSDFLLKPRQTALKEALSPHAHHLAARAQARGNLIIAQPLGGEKDHLGAQNLKIRQRILGCDPLELAVFLAGEDYGIRAFSRHLGLPPASMP